MLNTYPKWLDDAVFYEIYPQSFYDTNGDGIGDLPGISARLDYIASLGCNAIWIHPCFVSPFIDAGYDVSDFCKVAPRYGTNADMKKLVKECHKRNIRLCLDLVAGHTSTEHPWFKESAKVEKNEFTNRYIWTNTWVAPAPGMNIVNGFSPREGSFITNFFYAQPALNYGFAKPDPNCPWQLPMNHPDCIATREALKDIIRFWLDMGVDGYRVDMASSLIKNDPDKKAIKKLWHDVIGMIKKNYPQAVMISEWFNNVQAMDSGYDVDFASIFSFDPYQKLFRAEKKANVHYTPKMDKFCYDGNSFFRKAGKGDASEYITELTQTLAKLKRRGFIGLHTSNHDISRINVDRTPEEIELVFAFVLTTPGVPFIYYGDEIGMRYMGELPSKEGGYTRTGARTPMQWNDKKNAGFSTAAEKDIYLPVDKTKGSPTVESQEKDPQSLLNGVRKIAKLRHEVPALNADGDFKALCADKNVYPLVYLRSKGKSKVIVAINPSGKKVTATFAAATVKSVGKLLLGKTAKLEKTGKKFSLEMPPVSYAIFECE